MLNQRVLMSSAAYFSNQQPINPYYADESVDVAAAQVEHSTIHHCLETAGVEVIMVDAPPTSQDGVYTANWALVRGDMAILARLPNARTSEEDWAEVRLRELGYQVVHVPDGLRFSGQGDALPCGDYLFCGSDYRSDEAAQAFAAETLGYERIQLCTVPQLDASGHEQINASSGWPDSFYYDIDLALAVIKAPSEGEKGLIAYCPDAFVPESRALLEVFDGVDKIIVSEDEARQAFACNLVSTGQAVIMSAHAPQLRTQLEARGLAIFTPEVRELAKGGGYIRCTTLSL